MVEYKSFIKVVGMSIVLGLLVTVVIATGLELELVDISLSSWIFTVLVLIETALLMYIIDRRGAE